MRLPWRGAHGAIMGAKRMIFWLLLLSLAGPRLEDPAEGEAFRLWFTFLAEAQYYMDPAERNREVRDCSSLVRYAFREALAVRGPEWRRRNPLPAIPALPAAPARTGPLFETPEGLRHFADAKTLMRLNCARLGEDLNRARKGDLLFFEQPGEGENFHVMVYLGPSQFEPGGERYVVYHTGPVGRHPGEVRRLTLDELRKHPQPRWRPVSGNATFRGLYRWKMLEGNLK